MNNTKYCLLDWALCMCVSVYIPVWLHQVCMCADMCTCVCLCMLFSPSFCTYVFALCTCIRFIAHLQYVHVCECRGEKVASLRTPGFQAASEHMFVSVISWPTSHTGAQCVSPQTLPLPGEQTCWCGVWVKTLLPKRSCSSYLVDRCLRFKTLVHCCCTAPCPPTTSGVP